jgi:hypothetical protein
MEKEDQELVLRFFAFKNYRDHYVHDVGDFMTEYMELVSIKSTSADGKCTIDFDYDKEKAVFEKTFDILNRTLGEHAFSGINKKGHPVSRFLSYHYEAFTLGIQKYLGAVDVCDPEVIKRLKEAFEAIKRDDKFRQITTGGGKNYAKPLSERINFVEKGLGQIL